MPRRALPSKIQLHKLNSAKEAQPQHKTLSKARKLSYNKRRAAAGEESQQAKVIDRSAAQQEKLSHSKRSSGEQATLSYNELCSSTVGKLQQVSSATQADLSKKGSATAVEAQQSKRSSATTSVAQLKQPKLIKPGSSTQAYASNSQQERLSHSS